MDEILTYIAYYFKSGENDQFSSDTIYMHIGNCIEMRNPNINLVGFRGFSWICVLYIL